MGKKNIIYLTVVLVVCLLVFLGIKLIRQVTKPKEITIDIEMSKVIRINFVRPTTYNLNFIEESGEWKVYISTKDIYPCGKREIERLTEVLGNFNLITTVSEEESQWEKFGVGKSSGIKVELYYKGGDKPAGEFIIGKKLGYEPNTCYFRFVDKPEVWLSVGLKRYLYDKDIDYWRNKVLFSFDESEIEEIKIIHSTETVKLVQKKNDWYANDRKIENNESSIEIFLYNICNFEADGFMPEKRRFGKHEFSIKVKTKDSSGDEVLFGHKIGKEKYIIKKRNEDTIYWMYWYKLPRFKKFLNYFLQ